MSEGIIQFNQTSLILDNIKLLNEMTFSINSGITVVLGPNGAGKTLTNKLLSLIYPVNSGSITWGERIINPWSTEKERVEFVQSMGMVWQQPFFMNRSVQANLELPLKLRTIVKQERRKLSNEWLKIIDLEDYANKNPNKLSLGQKQKISLARALICNPNIVILDEPTASLDPANKKWFEEYLTNEVNNGIRQIIWNTHDLFQVKRIANEVIILLEGRVRETGKISKVFDTNIPEVKAFLAGELP